MRLIFANLLMTLIIGASINQNDEKGLIEARKIIDACNKVIEITKKGSCVGRNTSRDSKTRGQFIALRDFLNSLEPVELFYQLTRLGKMETIFIYSFLAFSPDKYFFYSYSVQRLIRENIKKMGDLKKLIKMAMKKLKEYKELSSEMISLYRDLEAELSVSINLLEFFSYNSLFTNWFIKESRLGPSDLIEVQKEVQKAVTLKHPFLANNLYHKKGDIPFWLIYNHSLSLESESPSLLVVLLKERIIVPPLEWGEIDYNIRMELLNMAWIGIERALNFGGYPETKEINLTIRRIFKLMCPLEGGIPI